MVRRDKGITNKELTSKFEWPTSQMNHEGLVAFRRWSEALPPLTMSCICGRLPENLIFLIFIATISKDDASKLFGVCPPLQILPDLKIDEDEKSIGLRIFNALRSMMIVMM